MERKGDGGREKEVGGGRGERGREGRGKEREGRRRQAPDTRYHSALQVYRYQSPSPSVLPQALRVAVHNLFHIRVKLPEEKRCSN
jgi:hypothetical protein